MLNTISHIHNRELTKPLSFLGNLLDDTLLILVVTVNQAAITELNTPPNFVENVGGDEVVLKRKRLHSTVTRWFLVAKFYLFPMNLYYAEIIARIVIVS